MRAIEPSSFMISQMTPAGVRAPARRARSTMPSVCPSRTSTPPSRARRGKTWPGETRSSGREPGSLATRIVRARSAALIPVVTPLAASTETVKAVPMREELRSTWGRRPSRSHTEPASGRQIRPRASLAMKLIAAGVACSASMARSPSFSREGSSTRMIMRPDSSSARISGIGLCGMGTLQHPISEPAGEIGGLAARARRSPGHPGAGRTRGQAGAWPSQRVGTEPMLRRHHAVLGVLLAAACGSSEEKPEAPVEPAVLPGARGAAIEIVTSRELEEVARLEDARSLGGGHLISLLASERDARVRARAATALGRMPFPRFGAAVTEALVRALEDPELDVRLAAAFALGVRADPDSAGTLLAYRNDPEPRLRARLVEAASKLPDAGIHSQLILSLRDADLSVRMEAAVAAARWSTTASDAAEVDRALLDALHPYRITRESAPKSAVEAELVWRILWVLGRRKAELGRGPFLEYASSETALERLFALRGLAQRAPDAAGVRAALAALDGPRAATDWRVAYDATAALGRVAAADRTKLDEETKKLLASAAPLAALEKAAEHPSAHVRAGAMETLGSFADERRVLTLLQRGRLDLSASVRAAALRARVKLDSPEDALEALRRAAKDDDPVLRAAVADAASTWQDERASGILLGLARDPSLFVSTRAVEALGRHPSDAVRADLHGFLGNADNGLRLAAVLALKEMPAPADVPALAEASTSSIGDGSAEIAFTALQVLAAIGTSEALAAVEHARADPRAYVRAVATRLLPSSSGRKGVG